MKLASPDVARHIAQDLQTALRTEIVSRRKRVLDDGCAGAERSQMPDELSSTDRSRLVSSLMFCTEPSAHALRVLMIKVTESKVRRMQCDPVAEL
ncbi:hypothetical protein BGV68_34100 [Burkholderia ubonensis]|nr:hypothetical protein WK76_30470 [Burkholderia ubonensis]KWN63579.1 hypothetical protein WM24_01205 [Burkholderia ubonensis]OJA43132.1 hypothetical protein BGV68_34100 [Burkholderia ubonensis]